MLCVLFVCSAQSTFHQVFVVHAHNSSRGRRSAWLGLEPNYGPGPLLLIRLVGGCNGPCTLTYPCLTQSEGVSAVAGSLVVVRFLSNQVRHPSLLVFQSSNGTSVPPSASCPLGLPQPLCPGSGPFSCGQGHCGLCGDINCISQPHPPCKAGGKLKGPGGLGGGERGSKGRKVNSSLCVPQKGSKG